MLRHLAVPFVLLSAAVFPLTGQAPPPGCRSAESRQFDYWVGDWEVTDSAGGARYGTNLVTSEEAGCLVHEHWAGTRGGTGQSFNFYDAVAGTWEQVWVSSTGGMTTLVGRLDGGVMTLEGDAGPPAARVRNRIQWFPEPDGRVRQLWSVSKDGGKSWAVSFDGWYRRKG
jgi:hypothetical protein